MKWSIVPLYSPQVVAAGVAQKKALVCAKEDRGETLTESVRLFYELFHPDLSHDS